MDQEQIAFPDFQNEMRRHVGPLLDSATAYLQIGRDIFSRSFSGQLVLVLRQIARSVSNSMESVLILASNGCAEDAFRIARTMFESAVTIHYLESHPELVQDYVDFLWVKRKHHHDDLLTYAPGQAEQVDPQQFEKMNAEFERVRLRFTNRKGRVRNSWCQVSLRAMAEEIKADSMYFGLYGFTWSITHTDILALVSASGARDAVILVPSPVNIPLALQMGVLSYAMTLTAINQIAGLKFDNRLKTRLGSSSMRPPISLLVEIWIAPEAPRFLDRRTRVIRSPWRAPRRRRPSTSRWCRFNPVKTKPSSPAPLRSRACLRSRHSEPRA